MFDNDKGSLVAQLQKEVVDSGVPISDILRKAKILASQLKNKEFKRWIDAELKGYVIIHIVGRTRVPILTPKPYNWGITNTT